MLRDRSRFAQRRECAGGIALGVFNGVTLPLTMVTIRQLGAEVVPPVTVATLWKNVRRFVPAKEIPWC